MPLTSIRVLDLTRLLPGPYCTMLLADFGAEVIKVEDPKVGDYARENEPKLDENSTFFHALNRNKKSICLNLKTDAGRESFIKLVKKSDVVVESFRPGVMNRLGLDYETLKEINPKIIYCAITGYGQTGPYVNRPGHDINYLSYAGLLQLMGERGGKPIVPAAQIADIGGGALPAAIGILLALFEREKSGEGQFVDISMTDGVISWLQILLSGYLANHVEPQRGEMELSGGRACYEVYQTRDGRFLSVGALEPKFWQAFCTVIDREDLIPKLAAPIEEQEHMKEEIQAIISNKTLDEWMVDFAEVDACVAPVLTFAEVLKNPQVRAREMIQPLEHRMLGMMKQIGTPIKLSETPGKIYSQAPKLGEHTEEILKTLIEEEDIDG
ncbi:CaiB/BaiF CoA transferase family protein [Lentibacillus daqui]|uniref:CaiB/BaiF CoA transferase family protein n=1 Tax=Lentibacillus daqui TaxID=2911514 RepID=UPI0022B10A79|nr:CaiB/BaiF CoA-transferase family protein [Lentibacillus daqui]